MKLIISHIDELLDYFPVNQMTKKMRYDLIEATQIDYDTLLNQGLTKKEASEEVISHIAGPEELASFIPNRHSVSYYLYWIIGILVTVFVFNYVSNPDFLQFFLPTRMEFPDIIEKYIHYFFIVLIAYAALFTGYRYLPQKWLNRNDLQSALFLYTGTIMAALYFSIAIAFVWYTFNGFVPSNITFDLLSTFIYTFYKIFFSSEFSVVIYAIINALMFVLSRQAYHLEVKPEPYLFEKIYQPLNKEKIVYPEVAKEEVQEAKAQPLSGIFTSIKNRFQKKKQTEEKKQPTYAALEVTEEVISFLAETSSHL